MKEAKKLGQSILFTTNVSFTSRDEMNDAKKLGHSISESSLVSTVRYLRVNKVDALQHGSWVSPVVNLVYCHFQFFSNNSGEPYADNTDCQFQYWNWNFMYGTCFFHDKCTVNLVGDIFQMEVNDGWNSLWWPIYIVNSVGKAK